MDISKFTPNKTGSLVRVQTELSPDWAFIPDRMPPNWQMPPELIDLAIEATGKLEKLDGIGTTLPNPTLLLRPLEDREAIQSSKLEGTYASAKELLLFAQNPRDAKSDRDQANSWREVYNYREALRHGSQAMLHRPLTQGLIREMHAKLMDGVRGGDKTPGEFRRGQVGIGQPYYRFIPPPPVNLIDLTENFVTYINTTGSGPRERLIRPFLAHYQFETIHPFSDGNGRIGRALLALMIAKEFGHNMPWLYMSPYFERNKEEYIERLFRISANGEWSEWVGFCLKGAVEQANDAIRRCSMLQYVRSLYLHRIAEGDCSSRTHMIVERLFHSPIISITEVKENLNVAYKTAKADVELLLRAKILKKIPDTRPVSFVATAIFNVAYLDRPVLPDESTAPLPLSLQSPSALPDSDSPPEPSHPSSPPADPTPPLPDSLASLADPEE